MQRIRRIIRTEIEGLFWVLVAMAAVAAVVRGGQNTHVGPGGRLRQAGMAAWQARTDPGVRALSLALEDRRGWAGPTARRRDDRTYPTSRFGNESSPVQRTATEGDEFGAMRGVSEEGPRRPCRPQVAGGRPTSAEHDR